MTTIPDIAPTFNPQRPWLGGDLQTIRNFARRAVHALPANASQRLVVPLDDGTGDSMVASLHLPLGRSTRPLIALVHGIAGSENSCYMMVATAFFLMRGYPVLRINQRGAGPSRPCCRAQYHAGSSVDLANLIAKLDPKLTENGLLPIGFSLGGNVLLKFLGGVGRHLPIRRAATVSAPIDLVQASLALLRWRNFAYHRYIFTRLKRQCTAPGAELSPAERSAILGARNLWQFDDRFTARRNGYDGAEDYYRENAAKNHLGRIRHETLLIHAKDDPFVPVDPYLERHLVSNPKLRLLLPESGGHLGFHDPLGLWHLRQIETFFQGA